MSNRKPLYGHTSRETAYLVPDYPYGRLRCKIWFWLESDPKKGFRFVSQTENPKNGRINAEKKSTYCALAGVMFLDEKGHCHWTGLGWHSNAKDVAEFATDFPGADLTHLRDLVILQVARYKKVQPTADHYKEELNQWQETATILSNVMARETQRATNEKKG